VRRYDQFYMAGGVVKKKLSSEQVFCKDFSTEKIFQKILRWQDAKDAQKTHVLKLIEIFKK